MSTLRRLRRRAAHGEAGLTVVELAVVVFVTAAVMASLYPALESFLRHTTATEVKAQVLADTRRAVETIARDLRAANPIDELPALGDYDNTVRFSVYCSTPGVGTCSSARLREVEYRKVDNRLEQVVNGGAPRILLGPSGPSALPLDEQFGAVVNVEPVFRFYKQDGQLLATSGPSAPPSSVQFKNCAKSVEINLVVRAGRTGGTTETLVTQVDLRNWNEVTGC